MSVHKCLTCSGMIGEEQDEEMIPGTTVRYLHTRIEDCQKELSGRGVTSEALHRYRREQRQGHAVNLPGLDDMEKWDR